MGLRVMNYRARMIGANLEILNRDGGGTMMVCRYSNPTSLKSTHKVSELNGQEEFFRSPRPHST